MFKQILVLAVIACTATQARPDSPYNETLAKKIFKYSKVSYCDASVVKDWSCGPDCENLPGVQNITVHQDNSWGTQGYTAYDSVQDVIIVSFRGSSNLANWIMNINTKMRTYHGCNGCKVHTGFDKAYHTVADYIIKHVGLLYDQYHAEVVVTGHSLGGAMAVHAALDIQEHTDAKVGLFYTFAAPRIGNPAFTDFVDKTIVNRYRLTHNRDVVPHLPPHSFGFEHNSNEVWYGEEFDSHVECYEKEGNKCANQFWFATSADDHLIQFGEYTGCATYPESDRMIERLELIAIEDKLKEKWQRYAIQDAKEKGALKDLLKDRY